MKKFIVLYHSPESAEKRMAGMSSEDMAKTMEPWMEWAKKCGDKLVDMGTPLGNAMKITTSGVNASNSTISGYSILQVNDMKEAESLLTDHPFLKGGEGSEVEVHECLPIPGME